jgi:hypothetical protein
VKPAEDELAGALILVLSVAAFLQFLVFYVRSLLTACDEVKLSEQAQELLQRKEAALCGDDFGHVIAALRSVSGDCVNPQEMLAVFCYQAAITAVAKAIPRLAGWVEKERRLCTHFAAVALDCRLANQSST